jgi:hypothetical protein
MYLNFNWNKKRKFKQILAGLMAFVLVALTSSPSFSLESINYGEALQKSILFYEAQQTGKPQRWDGCRLRS